MRVFLARGNTITEIHSLTVCSLHRSCRAQMQRRSARRRQNPLPHRRGDEGHSAAIGHAAEHGLSAAGPGMAAESLAVEAEVLDAAPQAEEMPAIPSASAQPAAEESVLDRPVYHCQVTTRASACC